MALTRRFQLFVKEETTEDTAVSSGNLFLAANASYLVIDPSLEFETSVYNREVKRETLTRVQGLTGTKLGRLRFRLELTASGSNVGAAQQYGLLLRACGFRQEIGTRVVITSGTVTGGPMKHGETITQETSGSTAFLIGDTYTGMSEAYFTRQNDLGNTTAFTSNSALDWTGGTTGGVFEQDPTATNPVTNACIAWWPFSSPLTKITFGTSGAALSANVTKGDVLRGVTSGAIGIAYNSVTAASGAVVYIRRAGGHFTAGETIENVTLVDTDVGALAGSNHEVQFQIPTLSMGLAMDGVRQWISGARGTVRFSAEVGQPVILDFDFVGRFAGVADGVGVDGVTYAQSIPPVAIGTSVKFGGTSITYANEFQPCLRQWSVDMANDVQGRRCMASSAGIEESLIVGRSPTLTCDPDLNAEALYDWVNRQVNNVSGTRARITHGTTAPNLWYMQMPGVSFESLATGDDNGIAIRTVNASLHGGSNSTTSNLAADNEFVLIQKFQ